MALYYC